MGLLRIWRKLRGMQAAYLFLNGWCASLPHACSWGCQKHPVLVRENSKTWNWVGPALTAWGKGLLCICTQSPSLGPPDIGSLIYQSILHTLLLSWDTSAALFAQMNHWKHVSRIDNQSFGRSSSNIICIVLIFRRRECFPYSMCTRYASPTSMSGAINLWTFFFSSGSGNCEVIYSQFSECFCDIGWFEYWKTIRLHLCKQTKCNYPDNVKKINSKLTLVERSLEHKFIQFAFHGGICVMSKETRSEALSPPKNTLIHEKNIRKF